MTVWVIVIPDINLLVACICLQVWQDQRRALGHGTSSSAPSSSVDINHVMESHAYEEVFTYVSSKHCDTEHPLCLENSDTFEPICNHAVCADNVRLYHPGVIVSASSSSWHLQVTLASKTTPQVCQYTGRVCLHGANESVFFLSLQLLMLFSPTYQIGPSIHIWGGVHCAKMWFIFGSCKANTWY